VQRRSVTSYDVARAAGVSQSAVSRAFSPGASIAEKTRGKVLKAAEALGYQPNAIARSMSSARGDQAQKSGMVGVIVTRLENPFFAHTISRLSKHLEAGNWHMVLFTVEREDEVDEALNALMQYKLDGVIILSALLSSHMARACQAQGTPVMLFNRSAVGLGVSSVEIDNYGGGRAAADLLCETGHERIAFIAGDSPDATSPQREAGFVDRLAESGLEVFRHETGDFTFESGREAGLRLLARPDRPDAVFCASDVMALGVLHAARFELGLDIPRDFSLVGFDDIPAAAWPGHMLTTIRQPIRRMIREAADMLTLRMTDPDNVPETKSFEGELILRDTVPKLGGTGSQSADGG
jgi:DNA-binding LacI/PurR family transcriptional regulator